MSDEKRITVVNVELADLAFLVAGCTLLGRLCTGKDDIEKFKEDNAAEITGALFSGRRINQRMEELYNEGVIKKEDLEASAMSHAQELKEQMEIWIKTGKT